MRQPLYFFLFLLPLTSQAQVADSTLINKFDSLIQLSRKYTDNWNFELALEHSSSAEKIVLENFGEESEEYGTLCFNYGRINNAAGDLSKAETWYILAKNIQEKTIGEEHPSYAMSVLNLGVIYQVMGQYEKAESLLIQANEILARVVGEEHLSYAESIFGLAVLYSRMGQYEKAESHGIQAKEIYTRVFGKDHPKTAMSLVNLGAIYRRMGQYEKAESHGIQAKEIYTRVFGEDHPRTAVSLLSLGVLYSRMGQYEKAEPLLIQANEILARVVGEDHFSYAYPGSIRHLGVFYEAKGQYEKAESLLIQAKDIWARNFGEDHPKHAESINDLGFLYKKMGQYEKAEKFYLKSSRINMQLIEKSLHHLSEQEMNNYLIKFSKNQESLLTLSQISISNSLTEACYNHSIFYKGFLLHSARQIKQIALSKESTANIYNDLKSYHQRLAKQYSKIISEQDSTLISMLERKANDTEKILTRSIDNWAELNQQVTWKEIQDELHEREAAIEFVHYRINGTTKDSIIYAALILKSGYESPKFVPLFEEENLNGLLSFQSTRKADYVNQLYSVGNRGAHTLNATQKTLYEIVWSALDKELEEVESIYFSPTGLLHRINLGAISVNDEETLSDRFNLVQLGSTRQLISSSDSELVATDAILFGGILFEMDSTAIVSANIDYDINQHDSKADIPFNISYPSNRGDSWSYLKWTDQEINRIHSILSTNNVSTTIHKGYSATEESFKDIGSDTHSPRILHLATHGFFFPDPKESDNISQQTLVDNQTSAFRLSDQPMIRSGLVMAGGNYAWQTGKALQANMEDGILTAYEISQMNLSDTELVVLSACETGLGDIQGNEGVYGLQRAFKIAGVKYLVMSLWQVPDRETAIFMETFYRKLFEEQKNIPNAFKATQKELRQNPFITPYQWAGFVLIE